MNIVDTKYKGLLPETVRTKYKGSTALNIANETSAQKRINLRVRVTPNFGQVVVHRQKKTNEDPNFG